MQRFLKCIIMTSLQKRFIVVLNSIFKVIDALMFGEVFGRINSYYRQTSAQSAQVFICKDNGRCGEGNNRRSSCLMKCLIMILRFCEWFAPCILKATVKRTTKTLRILPPTFKPVSQQIRLVQVACILDSDWKKITRESRLTWELLFFLQNTFALGGKTRNLYRFSCKK